MMSSLQLPVVMKALLCIVFVPLPENTLTDGAQTFVQNGFHLSFHIRHGQEIDLGWKVEQ